MRNNPSVRPPICFQQSPIVEPSCGFLCVAVSKCCEEHLLIQKGFSSPYFLKIVSQKWKYWFKGSAHRKSLPTYCQRVPRGWRPFLPPPPPGGSVKRIRRAHSQSNGLVFFPQSLIKKMAQSVVEVMEDAKGKVPENLLANGGRSLACSYPGLSQPVLAHRSPCRGCRDPAPWSI